MNSRLPNCRLRMLCYLLPTLLSACTGNGGLPAVRSESQLLASTQLDRGIRSHHKGEVFQAEKHLSDSLRTSSAIEDNPARITALINLARLNRLNNRTDSATLHIDQAIKLANSVPELKSETAYEKSLIELAQKHYKEALSWASASLSSASGDTTKGVRLNLLARIHHAAGNNNESIQFALMALNENRRSGHAAEVSNSLRLLGSIARENKNFGESGKFLRESLEIDKQIGESHKIALDMEELAALADDQGDQNMMIDYLERAFNVHLSGENRHKAAAVQFKISEIYRKTGNMLQAEKALQAAELLLQKESPRQKSSSERANPSNRP